MMAARRVVALMTALWIITARGAVAQPAAPPPPHQPFAKGAWMLSLSASGLSEAWNYNGSREEAYTVEAGLTYGVRDRLAVGITSVTAYVSQRRTDAFAIGWLGGLKWTVCQRSRRTVSLDVEVGAARAEIPVPPRGTRFNYLWRVGASATSAVWHDVHAVAAFGWLHLSNNSLNGRSRNPDLQALGFRAGVLIPF